MLWIGTCPRTNEKADSTRWEATEHFADYSSQLPWFKDAQPRSRNLQISVQATLVGRFANKRFVTKFVTKCTQSVNVLDWLSWLHEGKFIHKRSLQLSSPLTCIAQGPQMPACAVISNSNEESQLLFLILGSSLSLKH